MNPIQQIFANVLGIWILCLGLATLGHRGQQFARWSWSVVSHPFRTFWGHYGSYLLIALISFIFGVHYAPAINVLMGP